MNKSLVTLLAAASATFAVPAGAETTLVAFEEQPVEIVQYGDLDLASEAGAATLTKRIDRAVDKVCQRPTINKLAAVAEWQACRADARKGAMEQLSVGNPFDAIELASNF